MNWMDGVNQGIDTNASAGGSGLMGWAVPPLTEELKPDAYFFFRPLPDALAISARNWDLGLPLFAANIHKRFGGAPRTLYSPQNTFPDPTAPSQSEDPARAWLSQIDLLYKKKGEASEQALELRNDMNFTLYILIQCAVYDANYQLVWEGGKPMVRCFEIPTNWFSERGWKRDFDALAAQGINPSNPYNGCIMRGFRSGAKRQTSYRSEGPMIQPGQAGYPLAWNQDGSPNEQVIEQVLAQVKPWHEVFAFVTQQDVDAVVQQRGHIVNAGGGPTAPHGAPVGPPASPPGFTQPGSPTPSYQPPQQGYPQAPAPGGPPMGGPPMQQPPGGFQQGYPQAPAPGGPPMGGPPMQPQGGPPMQQPQQQGYPQPPMGGPPMQPQGGPPMGGPPMGGPPMGGPPMGGPPMGGPPTGHPTPPPGGPPPGMTGFPGSPGMGGAPPSTPPGAPTAPPLA